MLTLQSVALLGLVASQRRRRRLCRPPLHFVFRSYHQPFSPQKLAATLLSAPNTSTHSPETTFRFRVYRALRSTLSGAHMSFPSLLACPRYPGRFGNLISSPKGEFWISSISFDVFFSRSQLFSSCIQRCTSTTYLPMVTRHPSLPKPDSPRYSVPTSVLPNPWEQPMSIRTDILVSPVPAPWFARTVLTAIRFGFSPHTLDVLNL